MYNNAALSTQDSIPISCVVKAISTAVIFYADDLLSLNWSMFGLEESFSVIASKFRKIGLNVNTGKCQVFPFNCPVAAELDFSGSLWCIRFHMSRAY